MIIHVTKQVAHLFQNYQKWVFGEKNILRNIQENPINISLLKNLIAFGTKQNSSKDVTVT